MNLAVHLERVDTFKAAEEGFEFDDNPIGTSMMSLSRGDETSRTVGPLKFTSHQLFRLPGPDREWRTGYSQDPAFDGLAMEWRDTEWKCKGQREILWRPYVSTRDEWCV